MSVSMCRRLSMIAGAIVLCASAAVTVTAPPAQAQVAQPYGAFAYSPSDHSVVGAAGGATATDAETAAISKCGKVDCIPVAWFEHAYATFDVGSSNNWGWGYAATAQGADQNALYYCQRGGGGGCHPIVRVLTPYPSSGATGSDLLGRACMINAPGGAPIAGFPQGHVGWAYLVNRDTGEWKFGANEGPSVILDGVPVMLSASKTWTVDANALGLIDTFAGAWGTDTDPTYFHSAGFYESIRCESLPTNDSSAALTVVNDDQGKPYLVPTEDCLSQAARVLYAYGAPIGEYSYLTDWIPNDYYNALPGFEPAQPLQYGVPGPL